MQKHVFHQKLCISEPTLSHSLEPSHPHSRDSTTGPGRHKQPMHREHQGGRPRQREREDPTRQRARARLVWWPEL